MLHKKNRTKALNLYLKDISRFDLLDPEDEIFLSKKIKKGNKKALDHLVNCNLRFVITISLTYMEQGMSLLDIIGNGNIGLIMAAERFDGTKGFKFSSYAVWWIRREILKGLAKSSRIVNIPTGLATEIFETKRAIGKLEQFNKGFVTIKELAKELDKSESRVLDILRVEDHHVSLDAPLKGGDVVSLHDRIQDKNAEATDAYAERDLSEEDVTELLDKLEPYERKVICMVYGIGKYSRHTLREVGDILGVSHEAIRYTKKKVFKKLKKDIPC